MFCNRTIFIVFSFSSLLTIETLENTSILFLMKKANGTNFIKKWCSQGGDWEYSNFCDMKNLAKVSQKIRKNLFAKNEKIVKLKKNLVATIWKNV